MKYIKYKTKKEVREHIQKYLNCKIYYEEFMDVFLKEFLETNHYYLKEHKELQISNFRKVRSTHNKNGYELECYIKSVGWKGISWIKTLNGFSADDIVKNALRRMVEPDIKKFRANSDNKCEKCGTLQNLEVHHTEPFEEQYMIMLECGFKCNNLNDMFKKEHDNFWLHGNTFILPKDNVYINKFLEIHNMIKLELLCKKCHKKEHNRMVD